MVKIRKSKKSLRPNKREEDQDEDEKQKKKERFAQALRKVIKELKQFNIKPGDDLMDIFPSTPYQNPLALRFFNAVKLENISEVWDLLQQNKFLVH